MYAMFCSIKLIMTILSDMQHNLLVFDLSCIVCSSNLMDGDDFARPLKSSFSNAVWHRTSEET